MAEPYLADIVGNFQRGTALGTAQRQEREAQQRQSRLSELASLAYGAQGPERQAAIGQAYGVDPKFAADLSGQLGKEDEARQTALLQSAKLLQAAPAEARPALYQRIRPSLGQYLPDLPPEYNEQVDAGTKAFITAYGGTGSEDPAGFRQLDLAARAAGYEPGTPEYQNYFQVQGGIKGRAPSGGYGFELIPGVGYVRKNPRGGALELYDPLTNTLTPIIGSSDINAPVGNAANPQPASGGQVVTNPATGERGRFSIGPDGQPLFVAEGVAPNVAQGIQSNPAAFTQGQATAPPQYVSPTAAAPASPAAQRFADITTRTPEQQAYQTELAKQQAQIDTYRTRAGLEAEGAAQKVFAEETAKAQAAIQNLNTKRGSQAQNILQLLDSAEPLIRRSTGSGAGAAIDAAGNFIGVTNEGANAIAALRPIAAALVGNVPRMEGPQSDADRKSYEQAAGDVANPTVPIPQRLQAVQTMRDLQSKYAEQNAPSNTVRTTGVGEPAGQPVSRPGATKTAVNPQTGQRLYLINGQWVP